MPDRFVLPHVGIAVVFAGLAVYAVFGASPYGLRVLTVAGVYALAAVGYQFVFGLAGALSMAQGAFFGLGAYAASILGVRWGLEFTLTLPAAMLIPAAAAVIVGLPVLRLQSHYFALATLGIAQVLLLAAINLPGLTGGANGLGGVPGVILFANAVGRGLPLAVVVWSFVAVGCGVAAWLAYGPWGRALRLVRDDSLAAVSLGLDPGRLRLGAFVLGSMYAGAAGALAVHTQRVVSPEVLEFPVMVAILTIAVVGGRGSIVGTILAAILLAQVPEWFRFLERSYLLLHGVVLLAVIVLLPEGIGGVATRWLPRRPPRLPSPHLLPPRPAFVGDVLRVEGVSRAFGGVVAVDGVSFTLPGESVTGLIGANGSGKTTLVNLISGIEIPDRGRVTLNGVDVTALRADVRARHGLARSFQTSALPPRSTVLDAVASAALVDGVRLAEAAAHAMAVLNDAGLCAFAGRVCGDLPAGLRRRVEIARAIARRPRLLLLDEPAAGLSDEERRDMAGLVRRMAGRGSAVLVIEHDIALLAGLATRLLVLDGGRLIADGVPAQVLGDPWVMDAFGALP